MHRFGHIFVGIQSSKDMFFAFKWKCFAWKYLLFAGNSADNESNNRNNLIISLWKSLAVWIVGNISNMVLYEANAPINSKPK